MGEGHDLSRKQRETAKLAAVGTGYSGSTLDKVDTVREVAEAATVRHRGRDVTVTDAAREVALAEVAVLRRPGARVDASRGAAPRSRHTERR